MIKLEVLIFLTYLEFKAFSLLQVEHIVEI